MLYPLIVLSDVQFVNVDWVLIINYVCVDRINMHDMLILELFENASAD